MNKKAISIFALALLFQASSFSADVPAQPVDMKALALRFDAEAKPFFTGEKKTTFTKVEGGWEYAQPYTLVPVLDGIMKVNNSFCNKSTTELLDADKMMGEAQKGYEAAAEELKNITQKLEDAKQAMQNLDADLKVLEKRYSDLKESKTPTTTNMTQLSLDIGKKRNELSSAKKDSKKFEKEIDKKKELAEQAKKKVAAMQATIDTFLANQKKIIAQKAAVAKQEKKPEEKAGQVPALFK